MKANFLRFLSVLMIGTIFLSSCNNGENKLNNGLIPALSGERWGYIDLKGEYVINPQFDFALPFIDGMALVMKGDKYGYVNEKGEYIISPKYDNATPFYDNVAWVVEKDGAPTLIDVKGNTIKTMKEVEMVWMFSDGLSKVKVINDKGEELYGYVDKSGDYTIKPQFENAYPFSEGLAAVRTADKMGYVNKSGKLVITIDGMQPFRFGTFINGYAIVENDNDDFGMIDKTGKYVINPQFDVLLPDGNDMYAFRTGNDWGWCDKFGKYKINPQFKNVEPFFGNNLAPAQIGTDWGFVDKNGKIVINPQFDGAYSFIDNQYAIVKSGKKFGIIDKNGKYTVNPQFDDISAAPYLIQMFGIAGIADDFGVTSQYFNAEGAADIISSHVNESGIDGVSFKSTISSLIQKYDLSERYVLGSSYGDVNLSSAEIGNTISATLSVSGNFKDYVSDGWWGTTAVLLKNATPNIIDYTISLKGKGYGRQEELMEAVAKKFKLKLSSDKSFAEGNLGKHALNVILMGNGIDIRLMKEPLKNVVSDSDNNSVDNPEASKYSYKGKIDNRYEIVMQLAINGENVSGTYSYTSNNTPIELNGTLNGDGSINLEEKTNGKVTGQFAGTWTESEISGTWISSDGNRKLPFLLTN